MNKVEFNENRKIQLEDILIFLNQLLEENNIHNSTISIYDIKNIMLDIGSIISNSEKQENKKILEIVKKLLPYKIMDYIGGYVIHRYSSRREQLFFKYEIKDDNLYLYNNFLTKGRQNKIKVTKINGIELTEIIKKFELDHDVSNLQIENMLMHPELLETIGLDMTKGYNLTLLVGKAQKETTFSLSELSDNPDFTLFEKEYDIPDILSKENFNISIESNIETSEEYTTKLKYSFDSCQKLLKMLLGLSKSSDDINLFNQLLNKLPNYKIKENSDSYLDWMFISSFLLFNEEKIKELSENSYKYIIDIFKKESDSYYLDNKNEKTSKIGNEKPSDIGANSSILTNGEIDYKILIKHIRNAIAHSSYDVIDENYIRCYGENFNIVVDKKVITEIISKLIYDTNIEIFLPIFYRKNDKTNFEYKSIKNEDELKVILENLSFINSNQTKVIKEKIDANLKQIIDDFKKKSFIYSVMGNKKIIKLLYDSHQISKHIQIDFPKENQDNKIDTEYVIREIRKYGNNFYKHSLYEQHEIILKIVRKSIIAEKEISTKLFKIIDTKEKTTGNIIDTISKTSPTEYIDYENYIQATMISYLNSLLLYPCNDRYNQLNCKTLKLDSKFTIPIIKKDGNNTSKNIIKEGIETALKNKETHKKNLEKEIERFIASIQNKEKLLSNENFKNNAKKEVIAKTEKELEEMKNKESTYIPELRRQIDLLEAEIKHEKEKQKTEEFDLSINDKYHQIIIEHLRNSLAHGTITFPNGFDFYNIGKTIIKFEDYDEETKTFEGTITLSNLFLELNQEDFLLSVFKRELLETERKERKG